MEGTFRRGDRATAEDSITAEGRFGGVRSKKVCLLPKLPTPFRYYIGYATHIPSNFTEDLMSGDSSPFSEGKRDAIVFDPNILKSNDDSAAADSAGEESSAPVNLPPIEPPQEDIGELYVRHWTLLMHIGSRKFRIPETESESLIQEVFMSFMTTTTTIANVKAWLVAAMCNASRHYWRVQARTESLPDDFDDHTDPMTEDAAEGIAMIITMQQALDYLQPRCRETLKLHYYEGLSANEVARAQDTTSRYAEKLIHNCLKRVREIYFSITAVKR
jgi:RNA polymerase sigma factor (sigma-70 family)